MAGGGPMTVSASFRLFALEQLTRVTPVTSRAMFGSVGVYADGCFFALMDDDTNRPAFVAAGMGPFMPGGDPRQVMQYDEVPATVLEDTDALAPWMEAAVAVARRVRRTPATRRKR